jgi:hypothetical protein
MAIKPDQFWGSNYYNHPPLTDDMVAHAEQQLGVELPPAYIALLRVQNPCLSNHHFRAFAVR